MMIDKLMVGVSMITLLSVLQSNAFARDATDITDSVSTSRSAECASYVGSYEATVFDHINEIQVKSKIVIDSNDTTCTFMVNQIPNHDFGQNAKWPHKPALNITSVAVPRDPVFASASTRLVLNPGAILLNGVKWEANPAACFGEGRDSVGNEKIGCGPRFGDHPWRYNVGFSKAQFKFDEYHAHVQKGGLYHYHATPRVLYTENAKLFTNHDCESSGQSPVIGFALDGFPLYGPCIVDASGTARLIQSSYAVKSGERKAIDGYTTPYIAGGVTDTEYNGQFVGDFEFIEGSGDLDECNGAMIEGRYGYYVTNEFPYAMPCLKGTAL